MTKNRDEYWMELALDEAVLAMAAGEIPLAAILVADGKEIGRSQTNVVRHSSWAAHAELFTLLNSKKIWLAPKPTTMYVTLEPCFLCFGAIMECGIDKIVYSMSATLDGSTQFFKGKNLNSSFLKVPEIVSGILEEKAVLLMRQLPIKNPNHLAIEFVNGILANYK